MLGVRVGTCPQRPAPLPRQQQLEQVARWVRHYFWLVKPVCETLSGSNYTSNTYSWAGSNSNLVFYAQSTIAVISWASKGLNFAKETYRIFVQKLYTCLCDISLKQCRWLVTGLMTKANLWSWSSTNDAQKQTHSEWNGLCCFWLCNNAHNARLRRHGNGRGNYSVA